MKSVLVIDKPEGCEGCPCAYFTEGAHEDCCNITQTIIEDKFKILDNCPLKDLPQKQVYNERDYEKYINVYGKGWNDCLGHITGEYNHYVPEKYTEENS